MIYATSYDRAACQIGIVHLGFGAFHRAHQAVYIDDYMERTGDLRWGIAAVNLRAEESGSFASFDEGQEGYLMRSVAPDGAASLRRVRPHLAYHDWAQATADTEGLLARSSVHAVTITVTESGYYTDAAGNLDPNTGPIADEIAGGPARSVYAYLAAGLDKRRKTLGDPITVLCCDNIRQNGKMLKRNLAAYLEYRGLTDLAKWVKAHVTFPCSMVDRITPRSTEETRADIEAVAGVQPVQPIMAEAFVQWVLARDFAGPMPDLEAVGVTVTDDVDPYEEAKIRILNGGHTGLTYMAALKGIDYFDAAMGEPELFAHFWAYETKEVLPGLTLDLPFDKGTYLESIADRFRNAAIGDTVARICADGMAKFPIFIRPTLASCLEQGILPEHGLRAAASWFAFARKVQNGQIPFAYIEPSWDDLQTMLDDPELFLTSEQLWGDLPHRYPQFVETLRESIQEMEQSWPA